MARARLLFESGKFFELVQMPFFSELEKSTDWEALLMGARAYEMAGMTSKAEALFDKAVGEHPDKEQVIYHRVMHAVKKGDATKAEQIIDQFLAGSNPKARHSIFYQLKAAIKMQDDQPDLQQALECLNKSLALNPRSEKGLRMKIMILEQMRKNKMYVDPADLTATYKQTCTMTDDKNLKKALIDRLFKSGLYKEAHQELGTLAESTPEYFFDMALLAYKSGDQDAALASTQKALDIEPNFLKGQMLKLEILSENKSDEAASFAIDWFKSNKNRGIARKGLLHLLKNGLAKEQILPVLDQDLKSNSDNPEAIAAMADALMMTGDYEKAGRLYTQLEDTLPPDFANAGLKARLAYSSAAAAYLSGNADHSLRKLESVAGLGRLAPDIYNLTAILQLHRNREDDLQQALGLARKAVKAMPTNPYFLDTLQFALLRSGKLHQALRVHFWINVFDPMGMSQKTRFRWVRPSATPQAPQAPKIERSLPVV